MPINSWNVRRPIVVEIIVVAAWFLSGVSLQCAEPAKLSVLLLGDDGHHRPADMARAITPALGKVGIQIDYTADVAELTPAKLAGYSAVAIFRDSGQLPAKQEAALLEFVEGGKGLVAIHCASHCFRNSDRYTALVGGRFLRHGTGVFRARIIDAQHPAMDGVKSFESWDETYVHNQLAEDIRVLMVREEQGGYEPYTWVRRQGKGRVFYTALGHDERTWKVEGFQKLLEQGIRWAAGQTAEPRNDVRPFEYVEANVPIYLAGKQWGTLGEPQRRMQKALSPAESMKHFHLPEGFEIQLYAAEPDIAKPIAMAWDERGRLWLAETVDYPNNRQPAGQGHDRIKICEDTQGTGRADKFTVFADHLSIPTSLVHAHGGVIVSQAPDMLFLKSTKGDDKADTRQVLFSGWETRDTHSGPSNLRWGFDNWIWGTVGYSGFKGTVGSQAHQFSQGIFRMKPDGTQLEFLTSTSNNTWGLGLGETGDVFASTANNQHSVYLGLPNRLFESVRGWHGQGSMGIEDHKKFHPITANVRQVDFHGGFTAACGHALYTARSFPPEYWNRAAFVCEPTGHLVHVDWLVPQGSGFVARDGWNILASDDEWSAPIAAEVGPDGALWVIDWYNYIVQHNPTPQGFKTGKGNAYETPLRDKTHGRIYRIVFKGAKATPKPQLDRAKAGELVAALGHENLWCRQTAQRLLVERKPMAIVPALADLVRTDKNAPGAIHALWTLHGLGVFAADGGEWKPLLQAALASSSPGVRRAALGVLPPTREAVTWILASDCLQHKDPHVRLEALLALSRMPGSRSAAKTIVTMMATELNANDRWISQAAVAAAAPSGLDFLEEAARYQPDAKEQQPTSGDLVRAIAVHVAREANPETPRRLLQIVSLAKPPVAEAILEGVAQGWPETRPVRLDAREETVLADLPGRLSPRGLLHLAGLVKRWGQQDKLANLTAGLKKALRSRLLDEKLSDDDRVKAARDLIALGGDAATMTGVLDSIAPQASPGFTRGLIDALGQSTADEVGKTLVQRWPALTPAARTATLVVLLRRPAWTRSLMAGLEEGKIDKSDLSVEQAQFLSKHPDKDLAAKAAKLLASGGRLPDPDRQKVLDRLLPLAKRQGDKAKGKVVFETNCAKCHRHGDLGQTIGPDLTGVAVRDRADILIDILDPNRSVEGNYRQYAIETKKGLLLTGLLTGETKTAVELLDSEGKKHVVLREDIENLISSKQSLMPEGFEKLPEEELVSLLDFLTARSKYLPLPLGKAATITSVRGMFNDRDSAVERLIFPQWGPKTVFGVPFQVVDPRDGTIPNVILLHSPNGPVAREMPQSASVACNAPAKTIHFLGGVSGWGFPGGKKGSVSLIVRLHYADGQREDHPLLNGVHLADYIRVVDVPESKLAFKLRGQQVRYLAFSPNRNAKIDRIEFVKGKDATAPLVMAITIEGFE